MAPFRLVPTLVLLAVAAIPISGFRVKEEGAIGTAAALRSGTETAGQPKHTGPPEQPSASGVACLCVGGSLVGVKPFTISATR